MSARPEPHRSWGPGSPIVVFGDDWGRYVSTMQHLFRHIALEYPVVWVNAIGHRPPSLNLADMRRAVEKVKAMARPRPVVAGSGLAGGGAPRAIIHPKVLPWHHWAPVHSYNTRWLVRAITSQLAQLGLRDRPVLVTGSPPSAGVVGQLGEAASVYFCMDDFLNFPGVDARMIAPLERKLLQRVDALVATASSLTHTKRPASGITHHLPQGVNYEHFATPREEPEEFRNIPRPRIGFAGTVGGCCDLGLVGRIADTYPHASVVLVGPITADDATMAALRRRANVHVLGLKPYRDLPAYVQAFDVGIIPYVLNDWTRAVDPLKLLEYLAAGISVVCSSIPEAYKYANVVTVAEGDDAFVRAAGSALKDDREQVRVRGRRVARENTWEARARRLIDIINALVAGERAGSAHRSVASARLSG